MKDPAGRIQAKDMDTVRLMFQQRHELESRGNEVRQELGIETIAGRFGTSPKHAGSAQTHREANFCKRCGKELRAIRIA